ncbi:MAG: D-glycero-alpha-D-manno-heptose-1,7-bisphosphate 7-phosphatase [Acidimicrobiales bacterium]
MTGARPGVGRGRPGVILDRDGTIIVDHGYVGTVDRVELIAGAADAIASFNRAGIPVAVITNQSGVARGYYGLDGVQAVHDHLAARLADHGAHVDLFRFCPDHPDGTTAPFVRHSPDRKPAPGMALDVARILGLDLSSSWVVGDGPEDMGMAVAVGATGVFVGRPGVEHAGAWTFPDLASAAPMIVRRMRSAATVSGRSAGPAHAAPPARP